MIGPTLRTPPRAGSAEGAIGHKPGSARIVSGELLLDGVSTFLYGGELQYFRVRDPAGDATKTHAMWAETLDAMVAAKMNVVTTYVPWDYHATGPNAWSFTGARDLGLFLTMARDRGLRVVLKPGPLITAEWPRGFGTFGAVPAWWKAAHPEALERTPSGEPFVFQNGGADQTQPALLHPTYLASVAEFYRRFAEVVRPYLGHTVIGIQLDNETNGYWSSPFGGPGYSPTAVAFWRDHLRKTYPTIEALNRAYGQRHTSFEAVTPPTRDPKRRDAPSQNPWFKDWYDAGQRYIVAYLAKLRGLLEQTGIREPEVLFMVNDSPFTLTADRVHLRNVRLPDGSKRRIARLGLDAYPKWLPGPFPAEAPWQGDFFARRFAAQSDIGDHEGAWLFGAELQAGNPIKVGPFSIHVPAYATDQLLLRSIGRGVKGASLYIMRDGLNADGSTYAFGAPLDGAGKANARYEVVQRWGAFLAKHGADLQRSHEVQNRVAILVNERHAVPRAGARDNLQALHAQGNAALFGWLANAGLNPAIVEATTATPTELAAYDIVFAQNPDVPDNHVAQLLREHPGVVVSLVGPGQETRDGKVVDLAKDYGVVRNGGRTYPIPYIDGRADFDLAGERGKVRAHRRAEFFAPLPGSRATPFMWNRRLLGADRAVGWVHELGDKKRVLIGTDVYAGFNYLEYYLRGSAAFEGAATLARQLAKLGGQTPIVSTGKVREIAWARRSDAALYVFCANDGRHGTTTHVRLHDATALGIDPEMSYVADDALNAVTHGRYSGADLLERGVQVVLAGYGTAVLRITPA